MTFKWPWPRILKITPESDSTPLRLHKKTYYLRFYHLFFSGRRPYWIFAIYVGCHKNGFVNIFFHILHHIIYLLMYNLITYQFDSQKMENPPYLMVYSPWKWRQCVIILMCVVPWTNPLAVAYFIWSEVGHNISNATSGRKGCLASPKSQLDINCWTKRPVKDWEPLFNQIKDSESLHFAWFPYKMLNGVFKGAVRKIRE